MTASRLPRGSEQLPPGLSPAGVECSSQGCDPRSTLCLGLPHVVSGDKPCTMPGSCGQVHLPWSLCLPWHTSHLHRVAPAHACVTCFTVEGHTQAARLRGSWQAGVQQSLAPQALPSPEPPTRQSPGMYFLNQARPHLRRDTASRRCPSGLQPCTLSQRCKSYAGCGRACITWCAMYAAESHFASTMLKHRPEAFSGNACLLNPAGL